MKMNNEIVFRHEIKYEMTMEQVFFLQKRFDAILEKDKYAKNGYYSIRSLYFDDFNNTAYHDKIAGVNERKKYRIRCYDYQDHLIKLECKHKQGSYIYKEMVNLDREELERILRKDYTFLLTRGESTCQNFFYECEVNGLRPKVLVDYERIPYVLKDGDVRITFDLDIRESDFAGDLFDDRLPSISCLDHNQQIMEVKYTQFLPSYIKDILTNIHSNCVEASKYVMACDKRIERVGELLPIM